MSKSPIPLEDHARRAMAVLRGGLKAKQVMTDLRRGIAHPDALAIALLALKAEPDEFIGYCRAVQKEIERIAPVEAG